MSGKIFLLWNSRDYLHWKMIPSSLGANSLLSNSWSSIHCASLHHSSFKKNVGKLLEPNKVLTDELYHDEIVPGSALRPASARKFTAFYLSFLELGLALRSESQLAPDRYAAFKRSR